MSGVADTLRAVTAARPEIVVFGDLILDDWWAGDAERLSREAPVAVVEAAGRSLAPGGAANTAVNLAALGARVRVVGVAGTDSAGDELLRMLREADVDTSAVVRDPCSTTAHKTRVVAGESVLVRVDERGVPLSPDATALLRDAARRAVADGVRAQLVCDYGLGAAACVREVLASGPRPPLRVVDAHDVAAWARLAPDCVTPNFAEAQALLAASGDRAPESRAGADGGADGDDRAAALRAAGGALLAASGAAALVVTLDRDGSVTLAAGDDNADRAGSGHRTRAVPAPEHHANGAGDTFTAGLTAALAGGATLADAADLAQAAADVVTRRTGTTICSAAELLAACGGVVDDRAQLRAFMAAHQRAGRRVVFTNGCFDVLHRGHVASLAEARRAGDVLVVAINSDDSVRRLKGPERPINPAVDRAAVLAGLADVDLVTVFDEDTPIPLLTQLRPDVYVKGGDYSEQMLEEARVVRGYGGEVRMVGYVADHSTTDMVERIRRRARHARRTAAEWARTRDAGGDAGVLDVLVPSCDRPAELAVTLSGLAAQDDPAFRVVVSDQSEGAADWEHPAVAAMVRVLRAQGHPVELLRHLPRRGLAEHRDFLLEHSLRTAPDAREVLFLDDDVWLEPGQLATLVEARRQLDAGFVGAAVQGLSYLEDDRPGERAAFEPLPAGEPVRPEHLDQSAPGFQRWPLHNAANLTHLAGELGLARGEWLAYRVAWVGGCVLFDRAVLAATGGFGFWTRLPAEHAGEDVLAQWRVMEKAGGAGILPSGAIHLESPTTVRSRDTDATTLVGAVSRTEKEG